MKDRKLSALLTLERNRQSEVINLIASENTVSDDVREALGSETTNKYAEGYPHARYYGGNVIIDRIEELAQKRALDLYGLSDKKWGVNVQPLSGSPANLAVYGALVPQGKKIMGMKLSDGGHLTHGHKVSFSGTFWSQVTYGVDEKTERIDYDSLKDMAKKEKPALVITGYSAYPRKINFKKMREVADAAGALLMVDMAHISGLVAGGQHPSPFSYADIVTTTTHKTLRGPRGGMIFARKDQRDLFGKINKAVFPGMQGGPHMNQIAALAVALREAGLASFRRYTKQVVENAKVLAQELASHGWRIVSKGTDNHLILVDVWKDGEGVSGREASERLEAEGVIVNMNTIPYDKRGPKDPSGIRIGTADVTTKGMNASDMKTLAQKIDAILTKKN